jgi:hypothetical protein
VDLRAVLVRFVLVRFVLVRFVLVVGVVVRVLVRPGRPGQVEREQPDDRRPRASARRAHRQAT